MFKYIFYILFVINFSYGNILTVHKKILPISLLQVNNIIHKNEKNLNLAIIVNKNEEVNAIYLKDLMPKNIKSFKLNINIIYEKDIIQKLIHTNTKYDAIYCFDLSTNNYNKVINYSITNQIITFAFNHIGLKNGALLYIEFTTKIKIYLNKKTMKKAKISFNNRFLRMVNIYE